MNKTRPNGDSRVWMPFTQMSTAPEPPVVRRGNGVMLELEDGREVMDCISSWWVTLHGHGESRIATAISSQARQLEQVIAAGLTHRPAELLAQRLVEKLPRSLNRVFYSDNGSTAVEVALKMAFQYWKNRGVNHRTRFLSFEGAYHGDTLGAMSVGSRSVFTSAFEGLLFEVDFVPFAATHRGDAMAEEKESRSLEHLEYLLREGGDRYGAMIMEPLVQGAGGMRMCRGPYLCKLETLLREHGIPTIADEVMVGFGRTGEWFASDRAGTAPDIVCLAKGLTGGFLPLAVTACSEEIYQAFCGEDPGLALYHGHSYTANPLGCAAALESLQLLAETEERFRRMEGWHLQEMGELEGNPRLRHFRVCGTIAAVDLAIDGEEGYLHHAAPLLRKRFLERGFLLRPIGNVIYILPPYCIEREQLKAVYGCIREVVEEL